MTLVVALVIVMASVAVVLWPLFRIRPIEASEHSWERDRLEGLLARRDSAYAAIQDLDFEYRLGNLSEGDYLELRERYRERAGRVLQRLDSFNAMTAPVSDGAIPMREPRPDQSNQPPAEASNEA